MRILIAILLACSPMIGTFADNHEYPQLVTEGMKALQDDSLSKAEGLFLKAISIKPAEKTNAILYQYIGQLRVRQKRHTEALEAFNDALSLEPVSQSILMDRASLNIELGRFNHALNDLNDILTLNPKHIEALFFRAYIYAEQHLNSKARIDYEQLLLIKPNHRQGRLGLALLCDKDNRPREAMEHIDVLIRYWPDDATIYAVRGGMYQERRQYEQALQDMNHAIELEPENPDFYISRALLYKDFKQATLASADFRKAISLGASPEECAALMVTPAEHTKK